MTPVILRVAGMCLTVDSINVCSLVCSHLSGPSLSSGRAPAITVVVHQPLSHRQQSRDVSAIIRRAEGLGVPTVQVDWVVESLMHRRKVAL